MFDPDFAKRNPTDRWVHGTPADLAASHLSENGHVLHLLLEIANRRKQESVSSGELARSA
jgi:hypothetical protein